MRGLEEGREASVSCQRPPPPHPSITAQLCIYLFPVACSAPRLGPKCSCPLSPPPMLLTPELIPACWNEALSCWGVLGPTRARRAGLDQHAWHPAQPRLNQASSFPAGVGCSRRPATCDRHSSSSPSTHQGPPPPVPWPVPGAHLPESCHPSRQGDGPVSCLCPWLLWPSPSREPSPWGVDLSAGSMWVQNQQLLP